ncbi:MAG: hypothetical protein KHX55_05405 [Proteobacteria bacterium]|nr:hypothetical protein [Pseudomonadota bacterium]
MELDPDKIKKYNQDYRRWLAGIPEDCYRYECDICYCLAHVIASAAQKDGYQPSKICSTTSKRGDNFTNYVSVNLRNEQTNQFEEVKYDYHIATAIDVPLYKGSDKTETLVADPILFGKDLVTLKQWKQAMGCPDYDFHKAPLGKPLLASPSGYNIMKGDPADLDADARIQIDNAMKNITRCQNLAAVGWKKEAPKRYAPLVSMLMRSVQREGAARLSADKLR